MIETPISLKAMQRLIAKHEFSKIVDELTPEQSYILGFLSAAARSTPKDLVYLSEQEIPNDTSPH